MQLGVGKSLFPSWSASLTLTKEHGVAAATAATAAVKASTGTDRLDWAIRAMTSFDHALDATRNLPVDWFVPGAKKYYRGYEAAKQAVTMLVGSGLIPGAKERVGRVSLSAALDAFEAGVAVARTDRSRYGGKLATGWLDASIEDATSGGLMIGGDTARELINGLRQIQVAADRRKGLDEQLVTRVTKLFTDLGAQLDQRVAAASLTQARRPKDASSLFAKADVLLSQAASAAAQLARDAERHQATLEAGAAS